MLSPRVMGAKGKVSEDDGSFDRAFWKTATPEETMEAILELRRIYYDVMHPGTGADRLDKSVGGTRRLQDPE